MKIEISEEHIELVGANFPESDYGSDRSDWTPTKEKIERKKKPKNCKSTKRKARKRLKSDTECETDNSKESSVVNVCKVCGKSFNLVHSFLKHYEKCLQIPENNLGEEYETGEGVEKKENIKRFVIIS